MTFEPVLNLSEQSQKPVWLVRGSNKIFYVQKSVDLSLRPVYEELQKIAQGEGSGIPRIFEMKEEDGRLLIYEEWINGRTLSDILSEKTCSRDEVMTIVLRLCEILKTLHQHDPQIIHRDIKPSNIILKENGEVFLLDFDASRFYSHGERKDTTQLGTAGFAPPEQYGFGQCDARSDIYALGILMNVLLTGKHPKDQKAGLPFSTVIRKCTEMDMERRFQSVESLMSVLRGLRSVFPEKEKNRRFKNSNAHSQSWVPPGFRTGKKWKMVVAVFFYLLIFFFSFALKSSKEGIWISIAVGMTLLWVVILVCDYREICLQLPFLRAKNFWQRLPGIIFWTFCFFCVIVILLIGMESLFT